MLYDSDKEDRPRKVLDTERDFNLVNCEPPVTGKLHELAVILAQIEGGVSFAVQPTPSSGAVQHARQVMNGGDNGIWTGTEFRPLSTDPEPDEMFAVRRVNTSSPYRLLERFCIRRRHVPSVSDLKTMAVITDDACLVIMGTVTPVWAGTYREPLESQGPDGQVHAHTSNRAELGAAIAVLDYWVWWGEGWERIVIVTGSEYMVNHVTRWPPTDLWEQLSAKLGEYAMGGCEVSPWAVSRMFDAVADQAAKAAGEQIGPEEYCSWRGVMVQV
ncbi:hypothetical protein N657DRAFT_671754 [Parathielavia appendiculata]|uniref:RNase H type-1 domain-containing protein n=1 Tax=Parathielavia appendiculata TaxID=2587402 RepID=A0AAN6TZI2_9PEZI|nr:hypothetical protein N657DRAFT_671754 [Parathielavia appendiculata]